jgi:hypothetical protein
MSDSEPDDKPVKKEKKKVSEKQLENLRLGMAKLKAKREVIAKQKEEYEEKQKKGEIPADAPKPRLIPEPKKPKPVIVPAPAVEQPLVIKERKKREPKSRIIAVDEVKTEMALLRAELSALKKPAEIKTVETIVEKPVDRIVEKKLTGSDLLNEIFFRK